MNEKITIIESFKLLSSIDTQSDCFTSADIFKVDGLYKLWSLKIGRFSFIRIKDFTTDKDEIKSKSFHILNCEQLISIEIGEYSFSEFELSNLPTLQSIYLGRYALDGKNKESWSFISRSKKKCIQRYNRSFLLKTCFIIST